MSDSQWVSISVGEEERHFCTFLLFTHAVWHDSHVISRSAFGLKLVDHFPHLYQNGSLAGELDYQHIYTVAINDATSMKVDAATL